MLHLHRIVKRCFNQQLYPMEQVKKFISPGAWFSMNYPADWNEFEDGEGSFLFYNPADWTGNFRISAFKGNASYGAEVLKQELKENRNARRVVVGDWTCAYSCESFEEEGHVYEQHLWVTGCNDIAFECSFTVSQGQPAAQAEMVVASLQLREADVKYPAEWIPIRLSEIYQINEAYEWVENTVKDRYKVDFQGSEEDIVKMQQLVDEGFIGRKKKEQWLALGLVLCVIVANEVDGMEWQTMVDGNREVPVLVNVANGSWIDPMKLAWSKVKAGEPVNLVQTYNDLF